MYSTCENDDAFEFLIELPQINIDHQSNDKDTALIWAARKGKTKIVERLLSKGVDVSNSFVFHNPLKQILVSRAIVSSVTEHFEMDLMDQTVVFQQLIGNTNYQYAFCYILGVLLLNYRNQYIINQIGQGDSHPVGRILFTPLSDKKFENFEYYKKTKKYMKQFLFIIFCIFGRNVCNVY